MSIDTYASLRTKEIISDNALEMKAGTFLIICSILFFLNIDALFNYIAISIKSLWFFLTITTLISILVGITAFIIRQRMRLVFGILELIFAIFTSYHSASLFRSYVNELPLTTDPSLFVMLQLGATVFLIGRGLDNVVISMDNPPRLFINATEEKKQTVKDLLPVLQAHLHRLDLSIKPHKVELDNNSYWKHPDSLVGAVGMLDKQVDAWLLLNGISLHKERFYATSTLERTRNDFILSELDSLYRWKKVKNGSFPLLVELQRSYATVTFAVPKEI